MTTIVVVVSLSGIWAAIRWPLQRALAMSGFGDESRTYLIERTFREAGLIDNDSWVCANIWGDDGRSLIAVENRADGTHESTVCFFDRQFGRRLAIRRPAHIYFHFIDPPCDGDGDGKSEFEVHIVGEEDNPRIHLLAILRFNESSAELVGCIQIHFPDPITGRLWHNQWRKTDGNRSDLQVIESTYTRMPDGNTKAASSDAVAIFEWTEVGGVLRLRELSSLGTTGDGSVSDLFSVDTPVNLPDGTNLPLFLGELFNKSAK